MRTHQQPLEIKTLETYIAPHISCPVVHGFWLLEGIEFQHMGQIYLSLVRFRFEQKKKMTH